MQYGEQSTCKTCRISKVKKKRTFQYVGVNKARKNLGWESWWRNRTVNPGMACPFGQSFSDGLLRKGCMLAPEESEFKFRGDGEGEQLKYSLAKLTIWFRLVSKYKLIIMRQGMGFCRVCICHCHRSERGHLGLI